MKKLPEVEEERGQSGFTMIQEGVMPVIVSKINEIIEKINELEKIVKNK